ncbi:MAG: HisA/HisF-related TIM barrel protein [Pseudobdellovibrionaceae bacterium]|jgi:phosphoribosylformimino-5-aminoimidazole carboxamide ribotide isomerase
MGFIIPAVDLLRSQVVRLKQGNPDLKTIYSNDILGSIRSLIADGFDLIHVVDLDRAFGFKSEHRDLLSQLSRQDLQYIDYSGGIARQQDIDEIYANGIRQIMIGSALFGPTRGEFYFPPDMEVRWAVDVKDGKVKTHGWTKDSGVSIWEFLDNRNLNQIGSIMLTDIASDGMRCGPALSFYSEIIRKYPSLKVIASGGIRCLVDIQKLKDIGCTQAIVGKAYWDNPSNWRMQ